MGTGDGLTPYGEHYFYSTEPRELSEEMAAYSYNELCLVLDKFYGLKDTHDIKRFDDLLREVGLKEDLASTDVAKKDAALYQLLTLHLGDLHSGFLLGSPLNGVFDIDDYDVYGFGVSS